jgi:hypothetical protein
MLMQVYLEAVGWWYTFETEEGGEIEDPLNNL